MNALAQIYKHNLALLTDLYQLTMGYGYWQAGLAEKEAAFHLFFRKHPFGGGFSVACGLSQAIEYLKDFHFTEEDLAYLSTLTGNDDKPLFDQGYLDYLKEMTFQCDIDAIPEGTVVFPHEPLIRVKGPIIQCQLVETALLSIINFQTLVATKSARICQSAKGDPVLEFGLRRAQGIDGGLSASRAAYIGGVAATSNVLAGKIFDIPVKGTHAHSWVMCFDSELASFETYAKAMPNNCVFLVDTYDTIQGVKHAIEIGKQLRQSGHEMLGIRLDSGDLAYLSNEARDLLDEAGFPDAKIIASNDLDEYVINSLKQQGATIAIWGVGTRLATAHEQPALGGVYKLSALRDKDGQWEYKIKLSEQSIKISNPGLQQVRRFSGSNYFIADMLYDEELGPDTNVIIDPSDNTRRKHMTETDPFEDLLVPIFRAGSLVYEAPSIHDIRARAHTQLATFHKGIKRFVNPHSYPVGLEQRLYERKTELILKARGFA
ncbi:MAG: nicotinate phosphoribosyltransferase [Deltaproteobacteria bacterium]|nr:nicotinate phosphoribosyltransferase [Deltaproteobacteria bacterium]MBU50303.1 nicotinate phosphoribosyltransferase [Deltaproteobacteria bacterium]|tara:strand:- start:2479 stop:3945 length:1467 start_codon:yes stop_codon:yes gene_type:complete